MMEERCLSCSSSRATATARVCSSRAPSKLPHWYINMLYIHALLTRCFFNRSFSFPPAAVTKITTSPPTKRPSGRKEEKHFLLRNPKPRRNLVISEKQLVKWRTGLCQTKQTADTVPGSKESRIYRSNNVAADNSSAARRQRAPLRTRLLLRGKAAMFLYETGSRRIQGCPLSEMYWFIQTADLVWVRLDRRLHQAHENTGHFTVKAAFYIRASGKSVS